MPAMSPIPGAMIAASSRLPHPGPRRTPTLHRSKDLFMQSNLASRSTSVTTRTPAAAAFEPLEGRRLFAVGIAFVAPDTLVFTGNHEADYVNLVDNGAGALSGSRSVGGGVIAPFGPVAGIRRIVVNTHGNSDAV